jgi:hypothetical protein
LSVLYGGGDGAFSYPVNFAVGFNPRDLAAADFNGDGWLDAAVLNSSGVSVLINDQSWQSLPPPFITIQDATVTEGNTGTASANFTVTLSSNPTEPVTVSYTTADGSATTADGDYQSRAGTLTFNPGDPLTQTVAVPVQGDRRGELNETFFVNLTSATAAVITDSQGGGTITDDEPTFFFPSVPPPAMAEGNSGTTAMSFTVMLSAEYDQDIMIHFTTEDGSATSADDDYQAVLTPGVATIAAGTTATTYQG